MQAAGAGPVRDDQSEASFPSSHYTDDHNVDVDREEKLVLGYSVQKWIKSSDLSRRILEVRRRTAKEEEEKKVSSEEDQKRKDGHEVEQYWNDKPTHLRGDYKLVCAVRIMEEVFSTWIELKRMRNDRKYMGFSLESKVIVMQNAIRRVLAVKELSKKMTKNKNN